MRVTFEVAFQALPPSLHRHCTDEAQKAETVLSAVIHIYIYIYIYILLTKCEVKMVGYWPSSLFAFLCTETRSRSIKTQNKNEANIQPS